MNQAVPIDVWRRTRVWSPGGCQYSIAATWRTSPRHSAQPDQAARPQGDRSWTALEREPSHRVRTRASGAWVKLIGDFLGPDRRPRANWPPEVLVEATRRAHALGCRVGSTS
jgi:hypothetical protein